MKNDENKPETRHPRPPREVAKPGAANMPTDATARAAAILAQYRTSPNQAAAALYLAAAMAITYTEAAALVAAIVGA